MSLFLGEADTGVKMLHVTSSWVGESSITSGTSNADTTFISTEPFFIITSVEHYPASSNEIVLSSTYVNSREDPTIIPMIFAYGGGLSYAAANAGIGAYFWEAWKLPPSQYSYTIAYIKKFTLVPTVNEIAIGGGEIIINGTNFNSLMFFGISDISNYLDESYAITGVGVVQFLNAKDTTRKIILKSTEILFDKGGIEYKFISPTSKTRMVTRCDISEYIPDRAIADMQCLPIPLAIPSDTTFATISLHIDFTVQYFTSVTRTHTFLNTSFDVNRDFIVNDVPSSFFVNGYFMYTASTKVLTYVADQQVLQEHLLEYTVRGL